MRRSAPALAGLGFALACACALAPCSALAATAPERSTAWTAADLVHQERAREMALSPDGAWLAWVKSAVDTEADLETRNLVLTRLSDGEEIPLTRGRQRVASPLWSPDGRRLAFLSERALPPGAGEGAEEEEIARIWLFTLPGGEPRPLATGARSVEAYAWAGPDRIVFAAAEAPSRAERRREERKDGTIAVEDPAETPPVRLFSVALADGAVTRLTDNADWIEELALARDGKRAATVHRRSLSADWDEKVPPEVWLWDLEAGTRARLFPARRTAPYSLVWSPDGAGLYAVFPFTRHPEFHQATVARLWWHDVAAGNDREIDLGWERGLGVERVWPLADGFLALLADGVRHRAVRYVRRGESWVSQPLAGEHAERIFGLALSDDGRAVAYRHSTASRREQLYGARLEGSRLTGPRQLTKLNEELADRPLARTEIVRWQGANDEEVEGILYYPHGWQEGKRHPLVLSIHGGPAAADLDLWDDDWAYPSNLFAERGAFVLKANYHGSSGYGLDWVESICCGRYYELEIPDLERGVDALVARGLVDPDRVGTMGWSNGSILSIQLTVENPARYKAAAVGAGDVEWISDWGNVDFGHGFDSYYFGATPLSDPERYLAKSPLFRLDRVTTPTLIFFGTEDRNVPPGQGWTHYRALQHLGRAPVRFLLFPGEPHSLGKPSHRLRKVEEEMAWFDRHLFGTTPAETPAVAPDSPLAAALARTGAARHEGRLGVAAGAPARLVPEVVPHAGLEVGRFEVTRAQWAAFDPAAIPAPGTEELPATGISHERALAYTAWLSELTGARYRLPAAAEAEALYAAREGENTLDRWAGYAPNPEDAAALLAAAAALGGEAPLLLPVGSFPPARAGERGEPVFDLGGNAAEWTTAADGKGLPRGGSADRPHDGRERAPSPGPGYVGLRVVREPAAGSASGGAATP